MKGLSSRWLARIVASSVLSLTVFGVGAIGAIAHGGTVNALVESVVWADDDGLRAAYALGLSFEDGDRYGGATASIRLVDGTGTVTIDAPMQGVHDGVHVGEMALPDDHDWRVEIAFDGPDGSGALEFAAHEHHAEVWAGPVVRVDSADDAAIGSQPEVSLFALAAYSLPTPTPVSASVTSVTAADVPNTTVPEVDAVATTADPLTPSTHGAETHVAAVPESGITVAINTAAPAAELRRNLFLRFAHVAFIGLWVVAAVSFGLGRAGRLSTPALNVGLGGTVVSGVLLLLYGTPLGFPGFFRWSELRFAPYGEAYSSWLLLKLALVAVAVPLGYRVMRRQTTWSMWSFLVAIGGAVAVLTVVSQLHLLVHG